MDQRFLKFEEALEKLGISSERLNQLRDAGELRAYRDGSSWKFRGEEIEKMVSSGIPDPSPPSDIGLISNDELVSAEPLIDEIDVDDDLQLADDDDLSLADSDLPIDAGSEAAKPAESSGIDLAEMDDTVTAETSDVQLWDVGTSGSSDSILLSEEELGESVGGPASTIIGKDELADEDADLQLASDDDLDLDDADSVMKPDAAAGASDVLSSGIGGSGVLEELEEDSGGLSAFEDLDELEIDLDAESSRILQPESAQPPASAGGDLTGAAESDLDLDDDDEGTDPVPVDLIGAEQDEGTDPVPEALELEMSDSMSDGESDIDLDTGGEDFVLADGSGSDITLGSGDSGINLISPSDSGLALDDIPLEMGGSAILSSLSMGGGSDPDISLVASNVDTGSQQQAVAAEEDFQLTPLSEVADEDEGDSSSQVIALDAVEEDDFAAAEGGLLESAAFGVEDGGEDVLLTEDDSMEDIGLDPSYAGVATVSRPDVEYTVWNILALGGCAMLALVAAIMLTDVTRNIDSWNQPYALNSSLLDAILIKLGLING